MLLVDIVDDDLAVDVDVVDDLAVDVDDLAVECIERPCGCATVAQDSIRTMHKKLGFSVGQCPK